VFDILLRAIKDRLLEPLARLLGPRVAPNAVTLLACLVGLACAAAAWQQSYGVALALWAANRLLDGLDGTLARVHERQTDFGGYLDILLDFVVYAAVPTGLAFGRPTVAVLGACTVILYTLFLAFPDHLSDLFGLMAGLAYLTVAQRVWWARRTLPSRT